MDALIKSNMNCAVKYARGKCSSISDKTLVLQAGEPKKQRLVESRLFRQWEKH